MSHYNLMYSADFYKVSHKAQYPENITRIHSTLVARGANYNPQINEENFMWFGHSLYLEKLNQFSDWFFNLSHNALLSVLEEYKNFLDVRLGGDNEVSHWMDLWELNELPIKISAQAEKSIISFQEPLLTVENTNDEYAWLVGFIETTLLSNIWPVTTAANRAWHIRECIEGYMINHTDEEREGIDFMAHDFSYRGMAGDEAAMLTGCGHLANFKGSDTIPAILAMERVYGEVTGFSVPATEHSVMCAGGQSDEKGTFDRLLGTYPTGIVSVVSDTWDYFNTLTNILPKLKDKIMARDGKLVIRPDSGNPVDIVCGDNKAPVASPEFCGSLELLGDIFGYTLDSQGLKLLDPHIGLIYGDGMNQERIDNMLKTMVERGWSPLNIVLGVGAYTYQFTTRDELGFAFKATAVEQDGEWVNISKNPKTDPGKASLTGRFLLDKKYEVFNNGKL